MKLPDFKTIGTLGGKVVSNTNRPPLPPRIYSWYSFPLEVESNPGLHCGPGVDSASNSLSFQGVKRPGRGVDHSPPSGSSWSVLGRTLTFMGPSKTVY